MTTAINQFCQSIITNIGLAIEIAGLEACTLQRKLVELQHIDRDNDVVSWSWDELMASAYGHELGEYAATEYEWGKELIRKDRHINAIGKKTSNRLQWQGHVGMHISLRADGTAKYGFDFSKLDPPGLGACILDSWGIDPGGPVCMVLHNDIPPKVDGNRLIKQEVPDEEAQFFWDNGYLLVGKDTVWKRVPELMKLFEDTLPTDVDFLGYQSRFRSALIPHGYRRLAAVAEDCCASNGQLFGYDGCGHYDANHPDNAWFVTEHGPVAMQFTAWDEVTKTLFKGILRPFDWGAPTEWPIHFDHLQVKGVMKSKHKDLHGMREQVVLENLHFGIIKAKTRMGKVGGSFELLECLLYLIEGMGAENPHFARIKAILDELIAEFVNHLREIGQYGLAGRATRQDPGLARLVSLLLALKELDIEIVPMSIPLLARKILASLGRTMHSACQGGAVEGRYPIAIGDDVHLEPGQCVIRGYDLGTKLAVWRFPTVLGQGLRQVEVVEPHIDHLVWGELTPNVIYLHPEDLTTGMQGDDDGDEVGISADPRILELFSYVADKGTYLIEPAGEKRNVPVFSPEGLEYILHNPQGPVGLATILRSQLLAAGDEDGARAMSIAIQESIDSAKRFVRPTNLWRAVNLRNWHQDDQGHYHVHYKVDGKYITNNFMPEGTKLTPELIREFAHERLIARGCWRWKKIDNTWHKVAAYNLGWRSQVDLVEDESGAVSEVRLDKAVALNNWQTWEEKQYRRKDQEIDYVNWVHYSHNKAREEWLAIADEFTTSKVVNARDILPKALAQLGHPVQPFAMTWHEYEELRAKAGFTAYGKAMHKACKNPREEERLALIDSARLTLDGELSQLTIQEVVTIWRKELTPCWRTNTYGRVNYYDEKPTHKKSYQANKPNYAFLAASASNSAIAKLLKLENAGVCDFMNAERVKKAQRFVLSGEDHISRMNHLIKVNTSHAKHVFDENGEGIEFHKCNHCIETLTNTVVRSLRARASGSAMKAAMKLTSALNAEWAGSKHGRGRRTVQLEVPAKKKQQTRIDFIYEDIELG